MTFAVGSLVQARGRDWVVQPGSQEEFLLLRPLGGRDEDVTGMLPSLEEVSPAIFDWPGPEQAGDHSSARLLQESLRLGFRSSAGPFRSFGEIAVNPRPYQLVPLLMALRQDPTRLLIADDVGVGKTVEAGLIAKELLAQGSARGLAVLCPPHLTGQWQTELEEKFHLDAVVVTASSASRLERGLRHGQTLFERHPYVIVSLDFIKSDRRRDDFLRTCPDLVIVDEAHTCVSGGGRAGSTHQRHRLIKGLADDPTRHLVLVTATPHSGREDSFRALLELLRPEFADLPPDLTGDENRKHRESIARHLVQRRRGDLKRFLQEDTPFPRRKEMESTYKLTPAYTSLLAAAWELAMQARTAEDGSIQQRQGRWWAALGLLRAISSSPAAAIQSLGGGDVRTETSPDLAQDLLDEEDQEVADEVVLAPVGSEKDRLLSVAKSLWGPGDPKLAGMIPQVRLLLDDGYSPIIFCRFIETAKYVAAHLQDAFPKVAVAAVTGALPASDRAIAVGDLARQDRRILVATDCLSEGINLQEVFNAVVHYDLAWSPTRHEQREGRVDRYGQASPEVRVLTHYGSDNGVDRRIIHVLLRKHQTIRSSLGVSIPVPLDPDAIFSEMFGGKPGTVAGQQGSLFGGPEQLTLNFDESSAEALGAVWQQAAEAQQRSTRSLFSHATVQTAEVEREIQEMQSALGSPRELARFFQEAVRACGGSIISDAGVIRADLREAPPAARDALGGEKIAVTLEYPPAPGAPLLQRTLPALLGLASHVLTASLDGGGESPAARCGVVRTSSVSTRTTLLLVRNRFDLIAKRREGDTHLLAEEASLLAFEGSPEGPRWLEDPKQVSALLESVPTGNVPAAQAVSQLRAVLEARSILEEALNVHAARRAEALLGAHQRVRQHLGETEEQTRRRYRVRPHLPVDVIGLYVYLPQPGGPQ